MREGLRPEKHLETAALARARAPRGLIFQSLVVGETSHGGAKSAKSSIDRATNAVQSTSRQGNGRRSSCAPGSAPARGSNSALASSSRPVRLASSPIARRRHGES
jgi:hypothetical protein